MKKIVLYSIGIAQIAMLSSCSKDDGVPLIAPADQQIQALINAPYSTLTPSEQKVKMESEANAFVTDMEDMKTSTSIDALENLENLLSSSANRPSPIVVNRSSESGDEMGNPLVNNGIRDLLSYGGFYGIYTWDSSKADWKKTDSDSELKLVFPSTSNKTSNDAEISISAVASGKKVDIVDTEGTSRVQYNYQTNMYEHIQTEEVLDEIYLPASTKATLSINGAVVSSFETATTYTDGKHPDPKTAMIKIMFDNGYVWEMSGAQGAVNTVKTSITKNGKNLIGFSLDSTANIDKLIEEEVDNSNDYIGTANVVYTLGENFAIIGKIDLKQQAKELNELENSLDDPHKVEYSNGVYISSYNKKDYYTRLNAYNKGYAEGSVVIQNKYVKFYLVSKKEGTKIAEVIMRAEKSEDRPYYSYTWTENAAYPNGGYWMFSYTNNGGEFEQRYEEVAYLKFNDNTEVEMDVYFSSGFDNFKNKAEDFSNSFED
ncbi:MAG: hypothetical protein H6584_06705 [Flavobacteriales bacterium]|nr:hypothetical protein [Flavobacteriales bacterium]